MSSGHILICMIRESHYHLVYIRLKKHNLNIASKTHIAEFVGHPVIQNCYFEQCIRLWIGLAVYL